MLILITLQKIFKLTTETCHDMRKWRVEDSAELYNINGWGVDYFSINEKGNVTVTPQKNGVSVDLKDLLDELMLSDVSTPVLVRFPDILDDRIISISNCFKSASEEYGYKAQNFIIYPIKGKSDAACG